MKVKVHLKNEQEQSTGYLLLTANNESKPSINGGFILPMSTIRGKKEHQLQFSTEQRVQLIERIKYDANSVANRPCMTAEEKNCANVVLLSCLEIA